MQNASDASNGSLVKCLERMEALLAEAITLARSGPRDGKAKSSRPRAAPRASTVTRVDFSSNIRAFVKHALHRVGVHVNDDGACVYGRWIVGV